MQGKNNFAKKTDDLGFGYKGSYTDKKTNEKVGYLKILARPELIAKLPVNANGYVEISAFPMNAKNRTEKTPDIVLKPTISKKPAATASVASAGSGNALPF